MNAAADSLLRRPDSFRPPTISAQQARREFEANTSALLTQSSADLKARLEASNKQFSENMEKIKSELESRQSAVLVSSAGSSSSSDTTPLSTMLVSGIAGFTANAVLEENNINISRLGFRIKKI